MASRREWFVTRGWRVVHRAFGLGYAHCYLMIALVPEHMDFVRTGMGQARMRRLLSRPCCVLWSLDSVQR